MATHEMPQIPIPDLHLPGEKEIYGGIPVLVIGGYSDAGKNSGSEALESALHFATFDTSSYIGEQLLKMGVQEPHDRFLKGDRSKEYQKVRGKHIWSLFALTDLGKQLAKNGINSIPGASITGSRFVEEWNLLEEFDNVAFVWFDASQEVRAEREKNRARDGLPFDLAKFIEKDEAEQKDMEGMRDIAVARGVVIDANLPLEEVCRELVLFASSRFGLKI